MRIKEGDEWKAVFKTNQGLFKLIIMFFGLTNSPATFQTMINYLFANLINGRSVVIYMDDISIFIGSGLIRSEAQFKRTELPCVSSHSSILLLLFICKLPRNRMNISLWIQFSTVTVFFQIIISLRTTAPRKLNYPTGWSCEKRSNVTWKKNQ